MGETRARLRIYGKNGKAQEVLALVDTGATFTKIPKALALSLGFVPEYEAEVELSDGKRVKRALALAEVEIEGVRRPVLVALGEEGEAPLIGYTTLEVLRVKVNPVTGKLERTVAVEYREVVLFSERVRIRCARGGNLAEALQALETCRA